MGRKRSATYIVEKYPERVANVIINWANIGKSGKEFLWEKGKWDAAFKYSGNPSVGFDLVNSPFGNDVFTFWSDSDKSKTQFKNVFTGLIFYQPIESWVNVIGIPDIVDDEFLRELKRRMFLSKSEYGNNESILYYYNTKRVVSTYSEDEAPEDSVNNYINNWLK